jgi:hypothetical protein
MPSHGNRVFFFCGQTDKHEEFMVATRVVKLSEIETKNLIANGICNGYRKKVRIPHFSL